MVLGGGAVSYERGTPVSRVSAEGGGAGSGLGLPHLRRTVNF